MHNVKIRGPSQDRDTNLPFQRPITASNLEWQSARNSDFWARIHSAFGSVVDKRLQLSHPLNAPWHWQMGTRTATPLPWSQPLLHLLPWWVWRTGQSTGLHLPMQLGCPSQRGAVVTDQEQEQVAELIPERWRGKEEVKWKKEAEPCIRRGFEALTHVQHATKLHLQNTNPKMRLRISREWL